MERCSLGVNDTPDDMGRRQMLLFRDSMRRYYTHLIFERGEENCSSAVLTQYLDANDISHVQLVRLLNSPFFKLVMDFSCKVYPCLLYTSPSPRD